MPCFLYYVPCFPLAKSRVCPDGQSVLLFILAKRKKAGLSLESLTSTTSTIRQMTSLIIAACCFVTIISFVKFSVHFVIRA